MFSSQSPLHSKTSSMKIGARRIDQRCRHRAAFHWGIPSLAARPLHEQGFWDSVIENNLGGPFFVPNTLSLFMGRVSFRQHRQIFGAAAEPKTTAPNPTSSAEAPSAPLHALAPKKSASGTSAWLPSAPNKPSPPRMLRKSAQALPGPRFWGNGFVLAAQPGMGLTGKTVERQNMLQWIKSD